jgi:hypothetical protein
MIMIAIYVDDCLTTGTEEAVKEVMDVPDFPLINKYQPSLNLLIKYCY